ncbi:MAG: phenylalanine--tRNA ligase subunit beta, partial [Actinomycetota bacterium]|nr:phenylalanine--tRNA ligase subunit beta [Actinomycetota bacterium]
RFEGVVIGRVLEVGAHPNADKVRVTKVDVGDEVLDIICGAWNFEAGAVVPVAKPGAVLQGDFEITQRKIRGVTSNGMICSESELEVGEDAAGIMVLDTDYPEATDRVGEDFTELLPSDDIVFDVSITPNRPDCMSVYGLARELAAFYEVRLVEPNLELPGADAATSVTILDSTACPRFVGREVRGIEVGPSPHWIRARLVAAGVRPISNVVDASNYAMMEFGHPTHAFDVDRLGEKVIIRRAQPDEPITTLDDLERTLDASDIVVADGERPVAIAGVMGGADTEVNDETRNVFIEAAYWEPPSVLMTSKRLGLRSEASARFERGMDPGFCRLAADRVAQILVETAGGTVGGVVDEYPAPPAPKTIELHMSEIDRLLGIGMDSDVAAALLERFGFATTGTDPLVVAVPTRRPDVHRPADLIEEIARLYGFENIPGRLRFGDGLGLPVREQRLRLLRSVMTGAGFDEIFSFSFIGAADLDALHLPGDDPARTGITVVNPLRDEEGVMRTTLLPGLLKAASSNTAKRVDDVRIFEVGKVFLPGEDVLPDQPDRLGFAAAGGATQTWDSGGRGYDVYDATGIWETIARSMRLEDTHLRPTERAPFHPGRAAEIMYDGAVIGIVGEIHPAVAAAHGLEGRVIAGEVEVDPLLAARDPWQFDVPSSYPPQVFDLAFEIDSDVPAGDVLTAVDEAGKGMVEKRTLFDVYEGDPIPEGRKSIAINLTVRAPDRTLSDEDVAPIRRAIVEAVEVATGGTLRGSV